MGAHLRDVAACLALAASLSGAGACSLLVTGPPDPEVPAVEPVCTRSRAAPILDVLGGMVLGVYALALWSGDTCIACSEGQRRENAEADRPKAIGFSLGSLGLFAVAVTGFYKTAGCHEAHERYREVARQRNVASPSDGMR
jgi:hypothetical protein